MFAFAVQSAWGPRESNLFRGGSKQPPSSPTPRFVIPTLIRGLPSKEAYSPCPKALETAMTYTEYLLRLPTSLPA